MSQKRALDVPQQGHGKLSMVAVSPTLLVCFVTCLSAWSTPPSLLFHLSPSLFWLLHKAPINPMALSWIVTKILYVFNPFDGNYCQMLPAWSDCSCNIEALCTVLHIKMAAWWLSWALWGVCIVPSLINWKREAHLRSCSLFLGEPRSHFINPLASTST